MTMFSAMALARDTAKKQEDRQLKLEQDEKDRVAKEKADAETLATNAIKRRQAIANPVRTAPTLLGSPLGAVPGPSAAPKTLLGQ